MDDQKSFLRAYLSPRSHLWTRIAQETGVSRRAIAYLHQIPDRDPRYSTMLPLMAWVEKNDPAAIKQWRKSGT